MKVILKEVLLPEDLDINYMLPILRYEYGINDEIYRNLKLINKEMVDEDIYNLTYEVDIIDFRNSPNKARPLLSNLIKTLKDIKRDLLIIDFEII